MRSIDSRSTPSRTSIEMGAWMSATACGLVDEGLEVSCRHSPTETAHGGNCPQLLSGDGPAKLKVNPDPCGRTIVALAALASRCSAPSRPAAPAAPAARPAPAPVSPAPRWPAADPP